MRRTISRLGKSRKQQLVKILPYKFRRLSSFIMLVLKFKGKKGWHFSSQKERLFRSFCVELSCCGSIEN